MKKIVLLLIVILSFSLTFTGCYKPNSKITDKSTGTISVNQNNSKNTNMVFAKLPSPPVCKKITDIETINKVIDFINSSEKIPTENRDEAGWYMLITLTSPKGLRQYSVVGNKLTINDSCYKVSQDFIDNLEKLYYEIDAKEEGLS